MSFTIDKQTLEDLNIFGKSGQKSIFNIYNKTKTFGGSLVLKEIFSYPLSDFSKIQDRIKIIEFFEQTSLSFPFEVDSFNVVEEYLEDGDSRTQLDPNEKFFKRLYKKVIGAHSAFETIKLGVVTTMSLLKSASDLFLSDDLAPIEPYYHDLKQIRTLFSEEKMKRLGECSFGKNPNYSEVVELDRILRFEVQNKILRLLKYIYYLDVYFTVAQIATARGFNFAQVIDSSDNIMDIDQMYHPYVPNAVANSLSLDKNGNIIFLTGANMAGKSTYMKTFGIVVYLAHLGLPVPAKSMRFTPKSGLYTTINLPDNISMGYSHFYADVLRVKKVAEHICRESNLVVIFDELFRGTNVKDAYDATVAVTDAFAANKKCTVMISTHIIEAGEELQKLKDNIKYIYLPTNIVDGRPTYSYKSIEGITSDRHGMVIIRNEGIIEGLNEGAKRLKNKN